jgi:HlyD family secretion protein
MFLHHKRWLLVVTTGLATGVVACAQISPVQLPRIGQSSDQNATVSLNGQAQVGQTVTAEPTAAPAPIAPRIVVKEAARPTAVPAPQFDPKQLVKARLGDMVESLQLSGRVSAVQELPLGFGIKGAVNNVAVSPGQAVEAGALLASVDTRDLQRQLDDSQSDLQITRLRLQQLQQRTAAQAQARQQSVAQQQADAARQAMANQQRVSDATALAQDQLRRAQAELDRVQAGASQADRLSAQGAVATATGNLAKAQTDLARLKSSPTQADLSSAQQSVATAQMALGKAQSDRDKLMLPPSAASVAAAKHDVSDAEAAVTALSNPVSSKSDSSGPTMSEDERVQRLSAARFALKAAQANLVEVQKAPEPAAVQLANMAVDSAGADLAAAQAHLDLVKAGPTPDAISAGENAVQVAQIALTGAQVRLDDVTSHPTPDELTDAQVKVAQAQQALDRAAQPADTGSQLSSGSSASTGTGQDGSDDPQIQTLQLQHTADQQQALVSNLQDQITAGEIRAPFDGLIEAVKIRPGDAVADPQQPAIVFASGGDPLVVADLGDGDVSRLKPGTAATIQLSSTRSISGIVNAIVDSPNRAGHLAQIQANWSDDRPPLGATVQIGVTLNRRSNVVIIPQRAIHASGDRRYVEILDGNDRKQVDVQLGATSLDDTEIVSGVSDGQIVILPS